MTVWSHTMCRVEILLNWEWILTGTSVCVCVCVRARALPTGSHEGDGVQEVASLLTPMTWSTWNTPKTLPCVFHLPKTFSSESLKNLHLQLVTYPEYENSYSSRTYWSIRQHKPEFTIGEPYVRNNTMKTTAQRNASTRILNLCTKWR